MSGLIERLISRRDAATSQFADIVPNIIVLPDTAPREGGNRKPKHRLGATTRTPATPVAGIDAIDRSIADDKTLAEVALGQSSPIRCAAKHLKSL